MAAPPPSVSDTGSGPDTDDAPPASPPTDAAQPTARGARPASVSPSWRDPDSGAAQPASASGGAAQPTPPSSGAAQPTFSAPTRPRPDARPLRRRPIEKLTVDFYNVGIQLSEVGGQGWQIKDRLLADDLAKAFEVHELDILCLSEIRNIPGSDVCDWIRGLLSEREGPPVRVYAEGHYLTIVTSNRVAVLQCKLVSGFVPDQADRCFQHLRVFVGDDKEPVSIVNCHAPASNERRLTVDGRRSTLLACHNACAGDRFIWGGDFNTGMIQLSALVQKICHSYTIDPSAAQPGCFSLQMVFSNPSTFKPGDLAMTYGLRSFQTNSEVGASFDGASDAHDLVVAKVFLRAVLENATGTSPVLQVTAANPPLTWGVKYSVPSSAAQPATSSAVVYTPTTLRVSDIFGGDAFAEAELHEVLEKIGRNFLFGKVANIAPSSDEGFEAAAVPHITEKLEEFLRVVQEQRANHQRRNPGEDSDAVLTSFQMQQIHNEWINDYKSWMNVEKIQDYDRLKTGRFPGDVQKAHKLRRSAFSAYLFQIIGNKHVLLSAIKHPICSAAQPAQAIRRFMDTWEPVQDDEYEGTPAPSTHERRAPWTRRPARSRSARR